MWPEGEDAFRLADDDTVESVVGYYREQIVASQEILNTFDLDASCAWPEMASNLRWVAVHMIAETARHAGHADIVRRDRRRQPRVVVVRNAISRWASELHTSARDSGSACNG